MTESLVRAGHLSRRYGRFEAVSDISFELQQQQLLVLLGLNGAGKSSLLKMLSGTMAMTAGSIQIAGFDLTEEPRQARSQLGFLPEQPPLYGDLSVNEFLLYCARLRGRRRNQAHADVDRARQACGLQECGQQLIQNLSKGYRQRVGVAQAIVHRPRLIILDEPTSGLDPRQISEVRSLIRELAQSCGIILSTHLLAEAQALCDRVLIIHQGRLILDQDLGDLSLNAHRRLRVGLRRPPALDELGQVEGVQAAEALGEHHFRIRYAPDTDPAEPLVQAAVTHGWRLFELSLEKDLLEDTFLQLTQEELP